MLASAQPMANRTVGKLAALMPAAAQEDLVEWGPHRTPFEQLDAVLRNERVVDWPALRRIAGPLTDNRPVNEYYLLRRLLNWPR
jgi:hypothetical protein